MEKTLSQDSLKEAREKGIYLKKHALPIERLLEIRRDAIRLIFVLDGTRDIPPSFDLSGEKFRELSEGLMRDLLRRKPHLRRIFPGILRQLPCVRRLASEPVILETLKSLGVVLPVERSISLQLWLPWEELFRERLHQDTGGLISENSWTVQVPLHDVTRETGAAEIFPSTYKLGPLSLSFVQDTKSHFCYETVGPEHTRGMDSEYAEISFGDAYFFRCLNIHRTSEYQSQIRWSIVMRFDDLHNAPLLKTGKNPFESLRQYDFKKWEGQLEDFYQKYQVKGPC